MGVDEHRVLANPSDAGALGEFAFGYRSGIYVRLGRGTGWTERSQELSELIEGPAKRKVVIDPSGVLCHEPHFGGKLRILLVVVPGDDYGAYGSGKDPGRFQPAGFLAIHVM